MRWCWKLLKFWVRHTRMRWCPMSSQRCNHHSSRKWGSTSLCNRFLTLRRIFYRRRDFERSQGILSVLRGILRSAPTPHLQCWVDFSLESPQQYLMQHQYDAVDHKQPNYNHCVHIALETSTRNIIIISVITVIGINVFVLFLISLLLVYL